MDSQLLFLTGLTYVNSIWLFSWEVNKNKTTSVVRYLNWERKLKKVCVKTVILDKDLNWEVPCLACMGLGAELPSSHIDTQLYTQTERERGPGTELAHQLPITINLLLPFLFPCFLIFLHYFLSCLLSFFSLQNLKLCLFVLCLQS